MSNNVLEIVNDLWTTASPFLKLAYFAQATAIILSVFARFGNISTAGERAFELCQVLPVLWVPIEIAFRTLLTVEAMYSAHFTVPWVVQFAQSFTIVAVVVCLHGIATIIAKRKFFTGVPMAGFVLSVLVISMDIYFAIAVFLVSAMDALANRV